MEPGMSSGCKRPMQPDDTQYDQNLVKRMTSSQEGTSKQPEGKTESLEENMDTSKMKCIQLEKLCAELQTRQQLLLTEFQAQSLQNATLQANLAERIQMNERTESQRDEILELLETSVLTLTPLLDDLHARNALNRELEIRVQSLTWQLLDQQQEMRDQDQVFVRWKIHHNQQMEQKERELQQLQQQLADMQQLDEDQDQDVDEDEEDSTSSTHTPSESEIETDTEFNSESPVAGEGPTRAPSTHIPRESETDLELNPVSPVAGEGPTRAPSTHTQSESETEAEFNSGSPVAGEGLTKDHQRGL